MRALENFATTTFTCTSATRAATRWPCRRRWTGPVAAAASSADAETACARAEIRNLAWRCVSRGRTSTE